ncbi:hypothetical protein EWM64_g2423 [Hericium alpestre]|uniref:Major facilitator superfamily (MFS) profile domain-containing protein n=1 Tax=Hericium alpestre TaxID=135208 RepID=A0A4Z0A6Q9_9AGAM|nr:hypothetical protein EWM64_g2423 [Hericium alpestre]
METLIAARFLGGLGGGGIFTTSSIITSDMYSMRSRGLTQGVASVFNGGKSKSTIEVLKRIDYGGSATLMGAVLSFLIFLSTHYNEEHTWEEATVYVPLALSIVFFIAFVVFELCLAPEPMLAPFLLKQKIPVLVGISNFLVANCNFAVMYFFPMWFQTVTLSSASMAGLHLLPNSISMSIGSMFAGGDDSWMMHRTGKYKMINLSFGFFPFIAAILIMQMREDSPPIQQWLSIIPLGFGNAVVLQTMLIALLAHLPEHSMAVGTGFGQLFRGVGQVFGVGVSSAIFQYRLDAELTKRISGPNAAEMIRNIRHSAKLVAILPPDLQSAARESYATALNAVFTVAAASTLLAYVVRLPIPEKALEHTRHGPPSRQPTIEALEAAPPPSEPSSVPESPFESDDEDITTSDATLPIFVRAPRRLSTYESSLGGMDLESDTIGGSARGY